MTSLDKRAFHAWAYDDLLTNTTRGVLAEYIVAKALGLHGTPRVEWHKHDLEVDGIGIEVKSAAYVQSWEKTRSSTIEFDIRPARGWDARTNTYAPSAQRSADVYVFCLLNGEVRDHVSPLDVGHWTFYVLATSVLNREVPEQKKIRLKPLIALGPQECTYNELGTVVREAGKNEPSGSVAEGGKEMAYTYYADGDDSVYRLPEGTSIYDQAEVFRHNALEWGPRRNISSEFMVGEVDEVSEAEAQRVCEVIRARVTSRKATSS